MKIILTGNMIDAQEAYRIGLVNKVYPSAQLLTEAEALARKIMSKGPLAIGHVSKPLITAWKCI